MEMFVIRMPQGLVPAYDADYEKAKLLPQGKPLKVSVKEARNVKLHRLYFILISNCWEYLPEDIRVGIFNNSVEIFRKSVEVASGICERVYNVRTKEWVDIPKSISFSKMDNTEFKEVYGKVKETIFEYFLQKYVSEREFEKLVNQYY